MLCRRFISRFHMKKGEICVHELIVRLQAFRFFSLGDRSRIISLSVISHTERKLRLEVLWICLEKTFKPGDGSIIFASTELEHRQIVLLLQRLHKSGSNVLACFVIRKCRL